MTTCVASTTWPTKRMVIPSKMFDLLDAQFQKVFADAYKTYADLNGVALNSVSHPSPNDMQGLFDLADEATHDPGNP